MQGPRSIRSRSPDLRIVTSMKRTVGAFAPATNVSTVVNIYSRRYSAAMAVHPDPEVRFLQAIADPVRLSIIRQMASCDDAVCACDFVEVLHREPADDQPPLKVLREAGVVAE